MDLNRMKRTIMDMNGHKGRFSTANMPMSRMTQFLKEQTYTAGHNTKYIPPSHWRNVSPDHLACWQAAFQHEVLNWGGSLLITSASTSFSSALPSRTPTSFLSLLVPSSPISVTSSTSSLCYCHQSVFSSGLALCRIWEPVRHCILCVTLHLLRKRLPRLLLWKCLPRLLLWKCLPKLLLWKCLPKLLLSKWLPGLLPRVPPALLLLEKWGPKLLLQRRNSPLREIFGNDQATTSGKNSQPNLAAAEQPFPLLLCNHPLYCWYPMYSLKHMSSLKEMSFLFYRVITMFININELILLSHLWFKHIYLLLDSRVGIYFIPNMADITFLKGNIYCLGFVTSCQAVRW